MRKLYYKFVLWWNHWCPKHGLPKRYECHWDSGEWFCAACEGEKILYFQTLERTTETRMLNIAAWLKK